MDVIRSVAAVLLCAAPMFSQDPKKPRVFVTDSQSWEISGGVGGSNDGFGGAQTGGARPQTAEIIKTFEEQCKNCTITIKKEKADYIVILEHEGGKSLVRKDNKFVIFNKSGDSINSGSTRTLGNSVKRACDALTKDWASHGSKSQPESTSE
ncbi:MAG TPA: hypothetical protein VKM94_25170 [Blastocatellia bacterium]|nr:hypothetical protein [Blastocatellia bacterium]